MGTFRNFSGGWGGGHRLGGWITPAIRNIIIACTGVFVVQELANAFGRPGLYDWLNYQFGLVPYEVTHRLHLWQPVTYLFLHGGIWHLLLNMLFLWMFGCDIERSWGSRRTYNYFFLTGVGAGVINVLIKTVGIGSAMTATIGASGAIYGILLAAAILFPDRQIWLIPFPVMIPMRIYALGLGAIAFFSALRSDTGDSISHVSHLGGMLVGYLYLRRGSWFFRARNSFSDWRRLRARRKFEVYMRKHRDEPPSRPDHWVN
jgi:membrane associated rhomboid family serine protease